MLVGRTVTAFRLRLLASLLSLFCVFAKGQAVEPINLYVATDGNDTYSGRLPSVSANDGPFATLERARDEIRNLRGAGVLVNGATVHIRGGRYEREAVFELTSLDSGTEASPITYRRFEDEKVVLSAGRTVSDFKPVVDKENLKRLDSESSAHIRWTDLSGFGHSDFGEVAAPDTRLELFFGGQAMTLARWPNEGFTPIESVLEGEPVNIRGTLGDAIGRFTYAGSRPERWAEESDIWLHGYWFWDWSDQPQRVATIDTDRRVIELEEPYHHYGYRSGQRFYAFNLLSELDQPGEWYLDRHVGRLYFWPPTEIQSERVVISVLPSLVDAEDVSWISIQGIGFEASRSTAIAVRGGSDVTIEGCTITNIGGWAVRIEGGGRHGVVGCDISQTGEGGIYLEGGNRPMLTPGSHRAENNHIHGFGRVYRTYRPAISVNGVGNLVRHNLIHDGPHNAVQLTGNDHLIELNEIYDVCYETGDVGAFYMGRDWTERGTVIRHNFFSPYPGSRPAWRYGSLPG